MHGHQLHRPAPVPTLDLKIDWSITVQEISLFLLGIALGSAAAFLISPDLRRWLLRRGKSAAAEELSAADWTFKLLLISVGLVVLLVTALLPLSEVQRTIPYGIGVALLAGSLYSLLERWTRTDSASLVEDGIVRNGDRVIRMMELQRDIVDAGFERVLMLPDSTEVFKDISHASKIDMMYNTAQTLANSQVPALHRAITDHHCEVRILISEPESDFWKNASVRAANGVTDIPAESKTTRDKFKDLAARIKQTWQERGGRGGKHLDKFGWFQIHVYDFVPHCSVLIINDSYAWVTPYLPYLRSAESPMFKIVKDGDTGLFATYRRAFDDVWKKSKEVVNRPDSDQNYVFPEDAGVASKAPEGNGRIAETQPVSVTG
jgi:hypothetical protein